MGTTTGSGKRNGCVFSVNVCLKFCNSVSPNLRGEGDNDVQEFCDLFMA